MQNGRENDVPCEQKKYDLINPNELKKKLGKDLILISLASFLRKRH